MLDSSLLAGMVSAATMTAYRAAWRSYAAFAGAAVTDPAAFARWRSHLVQRTEYAPTTINTMLIGVRSIIRQAAEREIVSRETSQRFAQVRGVAIKPLKHRLKQNYRTKITPGQMRTLVDQPDVTDAMGLRDRALLLTLATSGCRISEVIGLEVGAVTAVEGGWALPVRSKTDVTERLAPLSQEAKAAIDAWLQRRPVKSRWIFTGWDGHTPTAKRLSAPGARYIINRHAASAGLVNIKPHDFRRFVGTRLAERNPRHAQRALGHRSITTTMQYYVLDEVPFGCTDDLF